MNLLHVPVIYKKFTKLITSSECYTVDDEMERPFEVKVKLN